LSDIVPSTVTHVYYIALEFSEHCMKEAGVENDTKEIPIAQFIRIL